MEELYDLCEHDDEAASLLSLAAFQKGRKTPEIASAMRDRRIFLDDSTARAMGRVSNLFLGDSWASARHITAMVARLVDGWGIQKNEAAPVQGMLSAASEFTVNFGGHRGLSRQEIMTAFIDGIEEGTRCVASWSARRRTAAR